MENPTCNNCKDLNYPPSTKPYIHCGQCGRDLSEAQNAPLKRSDAQHKSLFLWFDQIAQVCQNQGVTIEKVLRHTASLQVTKEMNHELCKQLISVLFGIKSTKDLKSSQVDTVVDHFVSLFAKEGVELPPFPSDEFYREI